LHDAGRGARELVKEATLFEKCALEDGSLRFAPCLEAQPASGI